MDIEQADGRRCRGCGETLKGRQQLYCSRRCRSEGRRTAVQVPCARCGRSVPVVPSAITKRRFCSSSCYGLSKRKPPLELTCEQCGRQFQPRHPSEAHPWCSNRCSGRARRKRRALTCAVCGTAIVRAPSQAARGAEHYCSRACVGIGKRRRAEVTCERCGRVLPLRVSMAKTRRFCSRACHVGPNGGSREVPCGWCGVVRRVQASALSRGGGKFCSRTCYAESLKQPSVTLQCTQCRKKVPVIPSAAGRQYCSRRCYLLAVAPRRFKCGTCGTPRLAPAWRKRRFCSKACANRSRRREPSPDEVARNRRILELHGEGLKAPQIEQHLEAEDPRWILSAAGVRQVISRARRGAGCR